MTYFWLNFVIFQFLNHQSHIFLCSVKILSVYLKLRLVLKLFPVSSSCLKLTEFQFETFYFDTILNFKLYTKNFCSVPVPLLHWGSKLMISLLCSCKVVHIEIHIKSSVTSLAVFQLDLTFLLLEKLDIFYIKRLRNQFFGFFNATKPFQYCWQHCS
jgi:hypothetical protein